MIQKRRHLKLREVRSSEFPVFYKLNKKQSDFRLVPKKIVSLKKNRNTNILHCISYCKVLRIHKFVLRPSESVSS